MCGRSLEGKDFAYYEPIHCHHCDKYFEYNRCAYNCSAISYNLLKKKMKPERTCYSCKKPYAVINCGKCHESLFREELKPSKTAVIEGCPICKSSI